MTTDERDEMRRLRREMELSGLGDKPFSMPAMRLQRLIDLEAKEICDYATNALLPSPSYTLAELRELSKEYLTTSQLTDTLTPELILSSLLAWLGKKERKANES